MSKYVICSPQYKDAILLVMDVHFKELCQGGQGREDYLKRKATEVSCYQVVDLPGYPMLDLTHVSSAKVNPELMDYLSAPPGVQTMAPENWDEVWQIIHDEKEFPIKLNSVNGTFECVICRDAGCAETTMNMSHVCYSEQCRKYMSKDPKLSLIHI